MFRIEFQGESFERLFPFCVKLQLKRNHFKVFFNIGNIFYKRQCLFFLYFKFIFSFFFLINSYFSAPQIEFHFVFRGENALREAYLSFKFKPPQFSSYRMNFLKEKRM